MSGPSTLAETPIGRKREALQFMSFAVTGGVAAICNIGSRILLSRAFGFRAAVSIAYLVGMAVAFVLARMFVFEKSPTAWHRQFGRFFLVNLLGFAQVWLVSVGLEQWLFPKMHLLWHPDDVAHLIGVASPVVVSYYAHKHFSFRGPR